MSDYDYDDEMSDESGGPFDDDEPYGGVFDDYLDGESSVSAKDFRDFKGRPMPTFEKEVKKRGFERFVVDMLRGSPVGTLFPLIGSRFTC